MVALHEAPSGTSVKYYITNNGGNVWEEVSVDSNGASMKLIFPSAGNDLVRSDTAGKIYVVHRFWAIKILCG